MAITTTILPGTIVQATRTIDKFTTRATYFGYCNGKHITHEESSPTHAMLFDEVTVLPTYTKKEAKQLVSELFGRSKPPTNQSIRNIIDLIKD